MYEHETVSYLGFSYDELNSSFIYDREEGKIRSATTGKEVGSVTPSGLVIKKRMGDKVINLSAGKLCYFLLTGKSLSSVEKIKYLDGDNMNFKPDNLVVVRHIKGVYEEDTTPVVVETAYKGIFYHRDKAMFIVRRGNKQAIYRTFNLKEAISIRNEWEKDKSIHRWDKSVEK